MKRLSLLLLVLWASCCVVWATDYNVGAGKPYPTLASVPWSKLGPGDQVLIAPGTYKEAIAINRSGAAGAPIRVRGTGAKPDDVVLDGVGAVTVPGTLHTYDPLNDYGLIYIGRLQGDLYTYQPSYISIENLTVKNAHVGSTHTDGQGKVRAWVNPSSGIYLCKPAHVSIIGCRIEGNGNGLFSLPGTLDVRVEGNTFVGNGNNGSMKEHNSYMEAQGIYYLRNRYVSRFPGSQGADLKDRSSGTVIEDNDFDDAPSHCLDLVDAEDGVSFLGKDPWYLSVIVRGNRFKVGQRQVNLFHFAGDTGAPLAVYKKDLYFTGNKVDIKTDQTTSYGQVLFHLEKGATARVWGNTITLSSATAGKPASLLFLGYQDGSVLLQASDLAGIAYQGFRYAASGTVGAYDGQAAPAMPLAAGAGTVGSVVVPTPTPTPTPTPDPKDAQIAALQAQVTGLQTQVTALQAQLKAAQDTIAAALAQLQALVKALGG